MIKRRMTLSTTYLNVLMIGEGGGQGDEVVVSEVQECEGGEVVEQVVGQPSDAAPRQLQPRVLVAVLVEGHQRVPRHASWGEDPCRGELIIVKHVLLIFI